MKIQEILKQSEGKSLEFKKEIPTNREADSQVATELRRQPRNISLEDAYELIKQRNPLGSRKIAGKLNIHQNTVLKRLRQLEEKG